MLHSNMPFSPESDPSPNMSAIQMEESNSQYGIGTILGAIGATILTVVTFLAQIVVFLVVSKDGRLRTPGNYFIVSLALADLLIALISMPVWTLYTILGYWPLSQLWCGIWNVVDISLCNLSVSTILCISIDRYMSLKHPLTYRIARTSTRAKWALCGIWIVNFIINGTFIALTQYIIGKGHNSRMCEPYYTQNVPLAFIFIGSTLWAIIITTVIVYCLIYGLASKTRTLVIRLTTRRKRRPTCQTNNDQAPQDVESKEDGREPQETPEPHENKSAPTERNKQTGSRHQPQNSQNKAARTVALLLFVLVVCWLPVSVVNVVKTTHPGLLGVPWLVASYWIGYLNSFLNPLCYAIGNPFFRDTLTKLFRECLPCRKQVKTENIPL